MSTKLTRCGVKSIRAKLMLSIGGIVVLSVAFFLMRDYHQKTSQIVNTNHAVLQEDYRQVIQLIEDTAQNAYSLAMWVASTPTLQQSFAERNRKALQAETLPIFRALKKKLNIAQFQFHVPPATSFLRLHKIHKFGDDLSAFRKTVLEANRGNKACVGLEKGVAGLGIRGVVPVSYQGRHIGSVEFGSGLTDALLRTLRRKYGFNASILVPDGSRFKFQAQSREMHISPESDALLKKVMDTGKEEISRADKAGQKRLTFFGPLKDYAGNVVGVVAIPRDITLSVHHLQKTLLLYIAVGLALVLALLAAIYFFLERFIVRPVKTLKEAFSRAGEGDLTQRVEVRTRDELGALSESFNIFQEKIQTAMRSIVGTSATLDTSANELNTISKKMSIGSEQTSGRSNTVAVAAEEMSSNMNSVAAATEQATANVTSVADGVQDMNASFSQITQRTEKARTITQNAVSEAGNASVRMDELGMAAQEIGKVTETITEISEQTNLLSLNATIEAARAGEAGKGFAVVANEIKELAKQTSAATGEIKKNIQGIQGSTQETVAQIERITAVVTDVDTIVSAIAGEIEQQTRATSEIADNMAQASQGLAEVTENVAQSSSVSSEIAKDVSELNQAAGDIASSSSLISQSAAEMNRLSGQLKTLVGKFRV